MQGKRKVRELYLQTNMNSQIVADLKTQIKEGSYYICVVCNRCFYKKSVISFKKKLWRCKCIAIFFGYVLWWAFNICRTCHKTMKNNCILCQAVFSKMGITFLPKESESISRLERVLVSRRILFKKVAIIPANICWSWRRLQDMSRRRLQHVFSVTILRLPRRFQDVLKTSCKDVLKRSWRRLQDLLEDEKL